jgi:hypothetical protein
MMARTKITIKCIAPAFDIVSLNEEKVVADEGRVVE